MIVSGSTSPAEPKAALNFSVSRKTDHPRAPGPSRTLHALFCLQLAALDVALRGPTFYLSHPRAVLHLVASLALLHLVASLRLGIAWRALAALLLGVGVTAQAAFFRYFHAPFDDQAAVAARLSWADVRPVVVHALPVLIGASLAIAALELAWLSQVPPARPRRPLAIAAIVLALIAGGPLRYGTTEVRTAQAAASFALAEKPRVVAGHAPLPPLVSKRGRVPSVLYVITESVRADEYVSPEVEALLPTRVMLQEMRSTSSYTAISMSVLLTGRPQLGPREPIAGAPDLFDFARATRSSDGRAMSAHYWSAHLPSFFEREDVPRAVDSYLDAVMMMGHPLEDVEEAVSAGMDRRLSDECRARIAQLAPPYLAIVHFSGTHEPYFFDEATAPHRPFGRVVTWKGMEDLRRSYQNAILELDRSVAACVRAFLDAQRGAPHVVVLTSDHGESFGDHWAIHHGQHLYDEQIHVPSFVYAGGGALSADEERALVSAEHAGLTHFDLLPTILDALGVLDHFAVEGARAAMPGRSLLRPAPATPAALPITNCSAMWRCPLDAWGVLMGDRKLTAQVWDGAWRCMELAGGEHEVDLAECRDLVSASRGFFAKRPNGLPND
jgi:hypothetical protein